MVFVGSVSFFVRAARFDDHSPFLWGTLSVASWVLFTHFVWGGVVGGFVSQALLYVGLTTFHVWREDASATS